MCDRASRKRKLRHDNSAEATKTVKGIFKKDDLDDSLSVSDWGLIIDENDHRSRQRNARNMKVYRRPLILSCEWELCTKEYTDYERFIQHLEHHSNNCDDVPEALNCCWQGCIYVARSVRDLDQHLAYHGYHTKLKCAGRKVENACDLPPCTLSEKFEIPPPTIYQCEWEYCNYQFDNICHFFDHVHMHVFHNPRGRKEGEIKCCWKACTSSNFPTQSRLGEHVRMHSKEKLVACPTCGNLFSNRTKLCDHRTRQLAMDRQSYLCSQCSKYFPSERLLRDHMRLHINHYKCSMCEMTCPKPSILAKHIRYKHLDERPYKCDKCSYTGVSKHNLDVHLKKHETKSQYTCSHCKFECRSAFGLDRHLQRKHGKGFSASYECHHCQKRFNRGGVLTRHLMKVHNYHWPSGHTRFRYKEEQEGVFHLQTVRYETLDVTEEIIKGHTKTKPSAKEDQLKFNVVKRQAEDCNAVPRFDVVISTEKEEPQTEARKQVVITIDDIDLKGNVLKSQTIESSEIICEDMKDMAEVRDDLIFVNQSNET